MLIGRSPKASIAASPSRRASRRGPGSSPKTARSTISSVSLCILGCSSISVSRGQLAISFSATSAMSPVSRAMLSPWKAGSISLRCSMCAPSSSRMTELAPTTGSRMRAPSPGWRTSGGAVKTSFTWAGSARITKGGAAGSRSVKRLP